MSFSRDNQITNFESEPYRFLSNFYPAEVELDGVIYPTVEHAYQAAKSDDPVSREYVRAAPTPAEAKRAGRRLKARKDWDAVKVGIMFVLLLRKFDEGTPLAEKLLATGNRYLEEGNWWGDVFWGVSGGQGKNMLGILLMGVRESLKGGVKLELELNRLARKMLNDRFA